MEKREIDPKIVEKIKKLEEKYEAMGQDLSSYLDGLLHAEFLTYWDYIHLDTLLSLQNPKTGIKDEMVFVIYHQTTELFFKLILHELDQLSTQEDIDADYFLGKLTRVNRYFEVLENSFTVMSEGMDREQFLEFRMSLLPASGFQSAQYRMIEIASTHLYNLVSINCRDQYKPSDSPETLFDNIYWKNGSTELATGKKTLTLIQFEEKYMGKFLEMGKSLANKNVLAIYEQYFTDSPKGDEIKEVMRRYDALVNVHWPLAHYKSAVRYLHRSPDDIAATGGTNWQKYLPPRFQKVIFFPKLWSEEEKDEWGKSWVREVVSDKL